MIVKKVYEVTQSGQLLVTIPRGKGIEKGDYVMIEKVTRNGNIQDD